MITRIHKDNSYLLPIFVGLAYGGIFLYFYHHYFNQNNFFWVVLATIPVSFFTVPGRSNKRYLIISTICLGVSFIFTTTLGIYCILIFSVLFIVEQYFGRVSCLLPMHLLLLSPIAQYIGDVFGISLRLQLSKAAGVLLTYVGYKVKVSGNLIELNHTEFLVDEACAGLYMLTYSLLFGIIILSIYQRGKQVLPFYQASILCLLLILLNISGNLVRIVLLIIFQVMPEDWFHEVLGLAVFVVYIILPFSLATKWFFLKKTADNNSPIKDKLPDSTLSTLTPAFLLLPLYFILCNVSYQKENQPTYTFQHEDFVEEKINESTIKLTNAHALIYVKFPVPAYRTDHNPIICWRGSGYEFKKIYPLSIDSIPIFTAELVKGPDKLYTAWWFDSGIHQTTSQWEWRIKSLMNKENFFLVNVTCENKGQLEKTVEALLKKGMISSKAAISHNN